MAFVWSRAHFHQIHQCWIIPLTHFLWIHAGLYSLKPDILHSSQIKVFPGSILILLPWIRRCDRHACPFVSVMLVSKVINVFANLGSAEASRLQQPGIAQALPYMSGSPSKSRKLGFCEAVYFLERSSWGKIQKRSRWWSIFVLKFHFFAAIIKI